MENKDIKICMRINPHINKQLEDIKDKLNNVPRTLKPWYWYNFDNNSKVIRTIIAIVSKMSEEALNEFFEKHRGEVLQNL